MTDGALIDDARLRSVYGHWGARRRGRTMPRRTEFDFQSIPDALRKHLIALNVVRAEGTTRFIYDYSGDDFPHPADLDATAGLVDDLMPDPMGYNEYVLGLYRQLIDVRRPIYNESLFSLESVSAPLFVRRLLLPLSQDGEQVETIVMAHVFRFASSYRDYSLSAVAGFKQGVRMVLDDAAA